CFWVPAVNQGSRVAVVSCADDSRGPKALAEDDLSAPLGQKKRKPPAKLPALVPKAIAGILLLSLVGARRRSAWRRARGGGRHGVGASRQIRRSGPRRRRDGAARRQCLGAAHR